MQIKPVHDYLSSITEDTQIFQRKEKFIYNGEHSKE